MPPSTHRSPLGVLLQPQQGFETVLTQRGSSSKTHSMASRLNDSPMDFDYDSPSRARSSGWLKQGDQGALQQKGQPQNPSSSKRTREQQARHAADGVFSFGGASEGEDSSAATSSVSHSAGKFLFHQPLSPTLEGPDVEMAAATPPKDRDGDDDDNVASQALHDKVSSRRAPPSPSSSSARQLASSGALARVQRSRNQAAGHSKGSRKGKVLAGDKKPGARSQTALREREWEDEEEVHASQQPRRRSLERRMGDTSHNYYFFNDSGKRQHAVEKQAHGGAEQYSHHHEGSDAPLAARWTDPEWCLGMAQFSFNSLLLVGTAWILYGIVRTLQRDVADKVREYELEFLGEIEACSQSYHLNKCGTEHAVPALASACASWQRCSAKDPAIVGRARVAAETVAEIVNGFVDVVSWKSMVSPWLDGCGWINGAVGSDEGKHSYIFVCAPSCITALYAPCTRHCRWRHQLYALFLPAALSTIWRVFASPASVPGCLCCTRSHRTPPVPSAPTGHAWRSRTRRDNWLVHEPTSYACLQAHVPVESTGRKRRPASSHVACICTTRLLYTASCLQCLQRSHGTRPFSRSHAHV